MNYLSATGKAKISGWIIDYTMPNGQPYGLMSLNVIIRESYVDTQATAAFIRQHLAALDEYIGTVDSDIKKFKTHVKSLTRDLERRCKQSTDVLANLFKGYKAASNKVFVEYIMRKEEDYEEGSPMTADSLMNLAANKYKIRLQRNEWNAKSESETNILALEAKLMSLHNKDKSKVTLKKSGTQKRDLKVTNKPKSDKAKRDNPKWMTKAPSETEKGKSKTIDSKDCWWWDALACWCRHHPRKCESKSKQGNKDEKKLKFASVMETVAHDEESESE